MSAPHARKDSLRGACFAAAAVLFSSIGACLICFVKSVPIFELSALAEISGGLVCLAIERKRRPLFQELKTSFPLILLLVLNQLCYISAFRLAPPVQADLILYLWPMLLVLAESLRRKHWLSSRQTLGVTIGVAAIVLLLYPKLVQSSFHTTYTQGYLAALGASCSWVCYLLFRKKESSTGVTLLAVGIVMAGLQAWSYDWVPLTSKELAAIASLGILVYGLAFPCWQKGLELCNYRVFGCIANATPVLSVAWLICAGFGKLNAVLFIATGLVTLSSYLINTESLQPAESPAEV